MDGNDSITEKASVVNQTERDGEVLYSITHHNTINMIRYCEALKFQLREKHFNVPPLCKCHPSIWDANPSQCARNCPFYNNHASKQ
jgi:hypothetical protein